MLFKCILDDTNLIFDQVMFYVISECYLKAMVPWYNADTEK